MKKWMLTLISVSLFLSVSAREGSGVNFREGSFDQLKEASARENKPIFIDMYATWCGPCQYMTQIVFPQSAAGDYFNTKFIPAKFDIEKGEGRILAERFSVRTIPTFLILDSDGKEITRIVGAAETAEEFIRNIEKKLNP